MIWVTLIGGLARIVTRLAWVWVHWTQRLARSLCRGTVEARGNQTHGRGVFQVPEQPSHRLPEEFGGNEWLVDELYERYQQDKNTVDAKWWPLFESFDASDGSSTNGASATAVANPSTRELPTVAPAAAAPAPAAPAPAAPAAAPAPAAPAPAPAAAQKAPATVARDGAKSAESGAGSQPIPAQLPKNIKAPTAPEEDVVSVLRGPAKAIAANMVTSLEVPTATSVRAIPA